MIAQATNAEGRQGFLVKHRLFISLPVKVGCFLFRNLIATQWTKQFIHLKHTTMKEMIDMLMDDNKSLDGMPWWFYAFVCPLGLIVLMAIAGTLS